VGGDRLNRSWAGGGARVYPIGLGRSYQIGRRPRRSSLPPTGKKACLADPQSPPTARVG
jgi:hypothetical protein